MNQPLPLPSDAQALRNYTETYTYDGVGNFVTLAHSAVNGSWNSAYAYDEPNSPPTNNRLTSTTVGQTRSQYTYDAHGNMTTMSHLPLMAWDFKDQLQATQTQVANVSAVPTTYYVYDSSGQRVRKVNTTSTGGVANERIYLGGFEVYREYNGTTKTLERQSLHVMDDKQRIAMVETLTAGKDGSPDQLIRYQFSNHLGSAILELDESAETISYEEYYPYGSTSYQAVDPDIKAAAKRYRYTGKERDEETGFNYHSARYYAPWLGIWTTCDPARSSPSESPYNYVSSRPTTRVDPSGLTDLVLPDLTPPPLPSAAFAQRAADAQMDPALQKSLRQEEFHRAVRKFNLAQAEYNKSHSTLLQGMANEAQREAIATVAAAPAALEQAASHPVETAANLVNPANWWDALVRAEATFSDEFGQAATNPNDYEAGIHTLRAAGSAMQVAGSVAGAADAAVAVAKVAPNVLTRELLTDTRGALFPAGAKPPLVVGAEALALVKEAEQAGLKVSVAGPSKWTPRQLAAAAEYRLVWKQVVETEGEDGAMGKAGQAFHDVMEAAERGPDRYSFGLVHELKTTMGAPSLRNFTEAMEQAERYAGGDPAVVTYFDIENQIRYFVQRAPSRN